MKGSIQFRKDRGVYYVAWYHAPHQKTYKIYRYRGMLCETRSLAEKLLASMQADAENGFFRIDKYTKEIPTDVIPYLWEWLAAIGPTLKPGTYKDYNNSIKNHLEPFFKAHPVQLHEIQLDTLTLLLNSINRSGKGKMNVMYCLHACLDFAWRSGRIQAVPPFPRRKQYGIVAPTIQWLPEERQVAIIEAIDPVHQPIYWWLKYHYRRPGEAQALHKEDFDGEVFTVHRTFSDKKLVDRTKTGEVHQIPCHDSFMPFIKEMRKKEREMGIISPFFFVNPKGKKAGKYYTNKFLNDTWQKACERVGENIGLYAGTKHSSCSQFLNEKGGNFSELQTITDHARLDSVKRYGKMEIVRKKELMERGVIRMDSDRCKKSK